MRVTTTDSGGRLICDSTSYVDFEINAFQNHDGPIFDEDGEQVGTMRVTIKTPELHLTDEQKAVLLQRHKACAGCPASTDLTDTTVTCRRCKRCRSKKDLTAINQTCPEGRWPR